jgi:CrcB protein
MEYIIIGIGGILGAITRYGISRWVSRRWPGSFPKATFYINISGSFGLGFLYMMFSQAGVNLMLIKNFAATGFLGAYTTYSTFSYEIICLFYDGEIKTAVKYFLFSLVIGLISAYLGMLTGRVM